MEQRDAGYDVAPEPRASAGAAGKRRIENPTLGYRGPARTADVAGTDADKLKAVTIPLWLLVGGVVVETAAAFIQEPGTQRAMVRVGVDVVAGTVFMLVGILVAARVRGIELGAFWNVVLKLGAITVAPGAVVTLFWPALRFIPLGGLLGWVAEFVLYFALLGMLFDLDESDTWYCVWVIFLVRLGVYFAILAAMRQWG